jgi:hypothetical protein
MSANQSVNGTGAGGFGLLDTETANVIGHYATVEAALDDVADTVRRYGRESAAARNLAPFRWDSAEAGEDLPVGNALIERALAARSQSYAL